MSVSTPTPENVKSKAKIVRQFLNERCKVDVSHSQSIELISQVLGFKDWNTAKVELSATEREREFSGMSSNRPTTLTTTLMTVGELRKALEGYDDSATIDANYEFNLGEFVRSIDEVGTQASTINQEFGFVALKKVDDNYANLTLALKNEDVSLEF